jgi:hypothetical protein
MEKTAIDWLIDQLEKYELYSKISFQCLKEIEEAKEMHKQEIIDAWEEAVYSVKFEGDSEGVDISTEGTSEQYYIETFGK